MTNIPQDADLVLFEQDAVVALVAVEAFDDEVDMSNVLEIGCYEAELRSLRDAAAGPSDDPSGRRITRESSR
jgi:hypothetical protein